MPARGLRFLKSRKVTAQKQKGLQFARKLTSIPAARDGQCRSTLKTRE